MPTSRTPTHDIDRRTALKGLGATGISGLIAGCSGITGGGGQSPIVIGHQLEKTGAGSSFGFWHERSARARIEMINEEGGINGREVEYVSKDTESTSQGGSRTIRELVQQEDADFVIGPHFSNVALASVPTVEKNQIPWLTLATATELSNKSRWVIRADRSTHEQIHPLVDWATNRIGTNWTIIYQKYSYGQAYRRYAKQVLPEYGGELLDEFAVPLGNTDMTSQLSKVPEDTDVLFTVLVGGSLINYIQQSANIDPAGTRLGISDLLEGTDTAGLADSMEGFNVFVTLPRDVDQFPTEGNKLLHEQTNFDQANQPGSVTLWSSWEAVSWIKKAAESVDWQGEGDNQAFVEYFEDEPSVEESSVAHPQGPKQFRAADHQPYLSFFGGVMRDGKFVSQDHVTVDDVKVDAPGDLTQMDF